MSTKTTAQSTTSPSAIAAPTTDIGTQTHVEPDPIAALIAAHAPTHAAELLRPLPTMSEAAKADWNQRVKQARHNAEGTPRGLIPVSGIRCGEYL